METQWDYEALQDCPEDVIWELLDLLQERAEAQKHPGGEVMG